MITMVVVIIVTMATTLTATTADSELEKGSGIMYSSKTIFRDLIILFTHLLNLHGVIISVAVPDRIQIYADLISLNYFEKKSCLNVM